MLESFKDLAKKARDIFDKTNVEENLVFQFIHNDAHHENILVKDKNISEGMGMIFMKERMKYVNGRIFINSSKENGTRITLNIPI